MKTRGFRFLNPEFPQSQGGSLGAALGVPKIVLGVRNPILGMASHDLSNAKTTFLGATLGAIPPPQPTRKIFICPRILGAFFQELGWSPRTRNM